MQVGRPAPGRHPEASLPGHGPLRRWEPRRVIAVRVGSQLGHGLRHLTVEFTMCVQRAVARRWQRAEVVEPGLSFSAMSVANLVSGRTTTVMTSLQSGARSAPHRRATSVVRTAQNGDRGQPAYPRSDLVPATGWLRPTPLLSQQHGLLDIQTVQLCHAHVVVFPSPRRSSTRPGRDRSQRRFTSKSASGPGACRSPGDRPRSRNVSLRTRRAGPSAPDPHQACGCAPRA